MRLLGLIVLFMIKTINIQEPDLAEIRNLYRQAGTEKKASEKLSSLLLKVDTLADPLLVCYKGASIMIKAKYQFNPLSKLAYFEEGKSWVEKAVSRDPGNSEIRLVRFSLQTNLPAFLGYNNAIEEDKKNLIDNYGLLKDSTLKININNFLSGSKFCSAEELKKLKKADGKCDTCR